jgi:hypothetical protein
LNGIMHMCGGGGGGGSSGVCVCVCVCVWWCNTFDILNFQEL